MTAHFEDAAADLRRQVAALERELQAAVAQRDEALAQRVATAEVLEVINASPENLAAVFNAVVEKAIRLCGADLGGIFLIENGRVLSVGGSNLPQAYLDYLTRDPPPPSQVFSRAVHERPYIHIPDLIDTEAYRSGLTLTVNSVEICGIRTFLAVPLRDGGSIVGLINLFRQQVRPFTETQIAPALAFAAQAQIAMKNARLFNETREALARQTATSEILHIISQSPTDARPVFARIVETAVRVLGCEMSVILLCEGANFWTVAAATQEGLTVDLGHTLVPIDPSANFPSRSIVEKKMLHLPDWSLIDLPEHERKVQALWDIKSTLYLPLLREGACIGVLTLAGKRANNFGPHEIAQAESFRDQALIAIENARLFNETQEALRQQTATSDILRVIASSPNDLQPVLDRLAETAARLCGAYDGSILLREGDQLQISAHYGPISITVVTQQINRGWVPGRAVVDCKPIHVEDLEKSAAEYPAAAASSRAGASGAVHMGWRAVLAMPLMREGEAVGAIVLRRVEPLPFSESQIALLKTFADQAVIAIENTRLFDEVQARTRDLQEALEQQTAAAEILQVISSSPTDVQPVFDAMARSAAVLCEGTNGTVFRLHDGLIHLVGHYSLSEEQLASVQESFPVPLDRGTASGRAILDRAVAHIPDIAVDREYSAGSLVKTGLRSVLSVPMLRKGEPIGSINVSRAESRPFSGRQIELLKTFADQAVIAINNVGLFNETQEALRQQTATSDILKVIASSPSDLQPVLDRLVETACRLCDAYDAVVLLREGDQLRVTAHHGPIPMTFASQKISRGWLAGRAAIERRPIHIDDIAKFADEYPIAAALSSGEGAAGSGRMLWRANVVMPLLREGEAIGVIGLRRAEPVPFSEGQIALLKTFSDQAVIAIQNTRLFDEVQARTRDLQEALQQQTATADVLKVISRSAFDLQTVLDTLIRSAVELIGAAHGSIHIREGDFFPHKASFGFNAEIRSFVKRTPISAGRETLAGRVALSREVERIPDVLADEELLPSIKSLVQVGSMLGVPLLRDDRAEGMMILARNEPGEFAPRQIELVRTFADQALIAIENVRLFDEVQARTRDLSEALQQQTATADVLKVISRSAFDLQTVLDTLISSAVELVGAFSGSISVREGAGFRFRATSGMQGDLRKFLLENPPTPGRGSAAGRVIASGKVECIPDVLADSDYIMPAYELNRTRALLGVPLLRDDKVEGALVLARLEPGPFTQRQIEIVQTFADQAVIAIENVRLFDEVQARTRDLTEALEHQTATSEVLSAISRSPTEVQPVFDAIARSATELCEATSGGVDRFDGNLIHLAAHYNWSPEALEAMRQIYPVAPGRGFASARAVLTRAVVHIPDIAEDPEYTARPVVKVGFRTVLAVPMIRDGQPIGAIAVVRLEKRPFTDRQIALLQTFAEQAVIAINNVRLFDEVQARTRDLTEALQQQTATADVLKVISRSAFDLQTVLDTLAASAAGLIGAHFAVMYLRHVSGIRADATFGASPELVQYLNEHPQRPGRETCAGRVFQSGEVQNIPDALADPEYDYGNAPRMGNFRALLGVPLFRDGKVEGSFTLGRAEPGPFTQRQIEIVQTFADQAVIAIENVRLFDEVQARTRDLSEALQQQTATAEVLKVISRSAFGLKTVLQTLVDSAVRLCASDGVIYLRDGDVFRAEAAFGAEVAGHDPRNRSPRRPGRDSITGRVALSGRVEQIPDNQADPEFKVTPAQRMNMRALLGVPLLRDGDVEGVFVLGKPEPGLFSDRAVELVRTFADQAVIAIQNVRLFEAVQAKTRDLEESLQLQTATSDVLKVISRSAFDLQAVFDTLISSAVELCGAFSGSICVRDGEVFRYTGSAGVGAIPALHGYLAKHPATPGRGTMVGRVLLSGKVEHIRDRFEDKDYAVPTAAFGNISRAFLGVPLLGKAGLEGALVLTREEPGHFSDRQVEIVQTFADQAVIAIENVRLFDEVQARTKELAASLDDLRRAQDRLIQSEKLASLGQLTAGIAHEIKNPLNFVNNFSALSRELLDELSDMLNKAHLNTALAEETQDLIGMVASNLDKVVSHGKRADSIVKNMLLHSREGSGERTSVNINAIVEEALNLAYHGARAERPGFNVTIAKSLDPNAGSAAIYAQEMTRVLLNLISNGFYATTKRKQAEANGAYEPTITASTRDLGHSVEIAIRDNGTGIPDEVKAKMFNPFFTTKPAGEGTGLGLSLSHDIVVKQHGGTIDVSTEPGAFTQFTIHLPRTAPANAGSAA